MSGHKGFEPFLAAFPEDLARIDKSRQDEAARKGQAPTSPNP